MNPNYNAAAIKASETLIKYGVKSAPVSPLSILEQMENVIIKPFSEMFDTSEPDMRNTFGKSEGAISSIHEMNGKTWYVVGYNSLLPHTMIQNALARELGHITLRHEHTSPENSIEAICFAQHLLCPRPLIHSIQATGLRITTDMLANLTGIFHQYLSYMRRTPGTTVPAGTNRFIRGQFMPFVLNLFEYYQATKPEDGSALADFGTFMDGYEE